MEQVSTRSRVLGWRLAAAGLTPFAAVSVYLFLSRWPSNHFTGFSDFAGLGLSVFIGALFVATLPIRPLLRILSLLLYLPVVGALVIYYTFWFIAVVYHDGL